MSGLGDQPYEYFPFTLVPSAASTVPFFLLRTGYASPKSVSAELGLRYHVQKLIE